MAAAAQFDPPLLDWNASDMSLYTARTICIQRTTSIRQRQRSCRIGKQGREVYKTFEWDAGDENKPDKILDKFEAYVRPRKNKRTARFKVKQRKQGESESFDNFVKT